MNRRYDVTRNIGIAMMALIHFRAAVLYSGVFSIPDRVTGGGFGRDARDAMGYFAVVGGLSASSCWFGLGTAGLGARAGLSVPVVLCLGADSDPYVARAWIGLYIFVRDGLRCSSPTERRLRSIGVVDMVSGSSVVAQSGGQRCIAVVVPDGEGLGVGG